MDLPPRFHRISGTKKDALGRLLLDLVEPGGFEPASDAFTVRLAGSRLP